MSPVGDKATATRRPHDAEASRRALLEAARGIFDEVGYDRATTREIGERAGVDPALIARYFDSKEGLFIAAIAAGSAEEEGIDFAPRALVAFLLERWDERGHSPIGRALVSPTLTPGAREQISAVVGDRVLLGLAAELRERGVAEADLRAELLVALAVGVAVTRANGTLETLAATPREQVLRTLAPLLDALEA
ncbi:MAG TPA: TetR family transcriptional regulator [Solirubrobacterales bacterium]|nr:TetR family transcriptional regulator [Solirubrobacterales bacterium]